MDKQPFVLTELENLGAIYSPLKATQRIKYTCFDVSKNFLVLGATSGGLYVFRREPCVFLQLIPNKDGAISQLSISPSQNIIAFATVKGIVVTVEHNVSQRNNNARRLQVSAEHAGSEITAFQWNASDDELYVGDDKGKISLINISLFMAKNIFQTPTLELMKLDSRIVQMDFMYRILLVSTMTRCYICNTVREQYKQIGQKLRDGEYGACFFSSKDVEEMPDEMFDESDAEDDSDRNQNVGNQFSFLSDEEKFCIHERLKHLKIFSARPGSRLWEVQLDGTVLSTHQFKQALAVPPTKIISNMKPLTREATDCDSMNSDEQSVISTNTLDSWSQQSFNFAKLHVLSMKFLFTFKRDGIYIFDPEKVEVILWNNEFCDIVDAKVESDTAYLWLATGKMHAISLSPVENCVMRLYFRKQYALCAQLCAIHTHHLLQKAPVSRKLHFLVDLGEKLKDLGVAELNDRLSPFLHEISKFAEEKQNVQKLKSGIFVVGNSHLARVESERQAQKAHGNVGLNLLKSLRTHSSLLNSSRIKEKVRSSSVSPETDRRAKSSGRQRKISLENAKMSQKSGSTQSLPELLNSFDVNKGKLTVEDRRSRVHDKSPARCRNTGSLAEEDESYGGLTFDKAINVPELPFIALTSPETVNALKDLKQQLSSKITSSTKTLKQKWLVLEDKVRSFGQEPLQEPLDVKTADYKERVYEELDNSDEGLVMKVKGSNGVEGKNDGSRKSKTALFCPKLDTTLVLETLRKIKTCDETSEKTKLTHELFSQIILLFEKYVELQQISEQGAGDKTSLQKSATDTPKSSEFEVSGVSWIKFRYPFPLDHYFQEEVDTLRSVYHESLKNSVLCTWLAEYIPHVCLEDRAFPKLCKNIYSEENLKLDFLLSATIIIYSRLLDAKLILEDLMKSSFSCYFLSWCAVLRSFQEEVLQYITSEDKERVRSIIASGKYPLPCVLNVMYFILQVSGVSGIDICLMICEEVNLKFVCYLVLKLWQHLDLTNPLSEAANKRYCQTLYLTYLTKVKEVYLGGTQLVRETFTNEELCKYITSAFVETNIDISNTRTCSCGLPLPVADHTTIMFPEISDLVLSFYWENNRIAFFDILQKVGLWQKFLSCKRQSGENAVNLLPSVIQLGDGKLLEDLVQHFDEDLWKEVLDLKTESSKGCCLGCGTVIYQEAEEQTTTKRMEISWSLIGTLLVKSLGAGKALQMLTEYGSKIKSGELDSRFYQACIFSTMVDSRVPGLRTKVIDNLGGLCGGAVKRSVFSPEVGSQVMDALKKDLLPQGKLPKCMFPEQSQVHHWGAPVDLANGNCPWCSLPLCTPILLHEGGVSVLDCAHSYHGVCLRQHKNTCVLCGFQQKALSSK